MRLNNKSFCKHIVTALSLGAVSGVHPASVDNVDPDDIISENGAGNLNKNARILNGEPAKREDFPYIGIVNVYSGWGSNPCQISLISDKTAVTVASCFLDNYGNLTEYMNYVSVYIGSGITNYGPMALIKTRAVHYHPEYTTNPRKNDIAIIELDSPVSKDIATPVAIYSGNVTDGMELVTVGYDFLLEGPSVDSGFLLGRATQSVSSLSVCKKFNEYWSDNNKDTICTLVKNGKSLSSGDGGGPLTYMNNGVNLLVGVANSIGRSETDGRVRPEDAQTNYYTNVYSHIDWVVKVTGLEKSYLLDTTARPSPNYSTVTNIQTYGDYDNATSASTILQSTRLFLVIIFSSILAFVF